MADKRISLKTRRAIMAILIKRHKLEKKIWAKKNAALTLLDELDELEAKRNVDSDKNLAKRFGISPAAVWYIFRRR